VVVLVSGTEKAAALRAAVHGPEDPDRIPIHCVRRSHGRVIWLVDRAAASALERGDA
jgi:6-phosphogluconolactonase/glucosamine-6-phosphate isomerase/deaminase